VGDISIPSIVSLQFTRRGAGLKSLRFSGSLDRFQIDLTEFWGNQPQRYSHHTQAAFGGNKAPAQFVQTHAVDPTLTGQDHGLRAGSRTCMVGAGKLIRRWDEPDQHWKAIGFMYLGSSRPRMAQVDGWIRRPRRPVKQGRDATHW
jgi:hypothetical protein